MTFRKGDKIKMPYVLTWTFSSDTKIGCEIGKTFFIRTVLSVPYFKMFFCPSIERFLSLSIAQVGFQI